MATQVQFRGGTTSEHSSFNGAAREVTVDTTKQTLVVQDGSTNGGFPLLRQKNPDNTKLHFGGNGTTDDGDLVIYHDSSDSIIHQDGTGDLRIQSDNSLEFNTSGTENAIWCDKDGGVKLYFNASTSPKLYTESGGVAINGDLSIETDGHIRVRTTGDNTSTAIQLSNDGTASFNGVVTLNSHLDMGDNDKIKLGNDDDLELYYHSSGADARIYNTNTSGWLTLRGDAIKIGTYTDLEDYIVCSHNAGVELFFNNVKHFETNAGGCISNKAGANTFTIGSTDASGVYLALDGDSNGDASGSDYASIQHGTDGDLSIHCDNPAGDSQFELYVGSGSTTAIVAQAAGEVQLSHNGTQKFATKDYGFEVSGKGLFSGGNSIATQQIVLSGGSDNATQIGMFNGHGQEQGFCFYNNGSGANKSWGMITDQQSWFLKQAAYNIGNESDLDTDWTKRVQVESGGKMTLLTGNLKFGTNGNGIEFYNYGTGTGVESNIFHDYEEGTWDPRFKLGGGDTGMSHDSSYGRYTKIGRRVYASFVIGLSALGSSTGNVSINGLPFTGNNDSGDRLNGLVTYYGSCGDITHTPVCYNSSNQSYVELYDNNGTSMTPLTQANLGNASHMRGFVEYHVDG